MPQPIAAPFTAAIIGLSHSSAAIAAGVGGCFTCGCGGGPSRLGAAMISRTSSPEQNAGSAPVMTMQRTSMSACAVFSAFSSSAYAGKFSALRTCGRSSVIVAT